MTSAFYPQNIFSSPSNIDFASLHQLDNSLLEFPIDMDTTKLNCQYYPSPFQSPMSNEFINATSSIQPNNVYYQQPQFFDSMLMVPPLEGYDLSFASLMVPNLFEHQAPAIDLVDQFIAEHEAALNLPEQVTCQQPKETSWSHWTYSRATSPEALSEGLSSSNSTSNSSVPSSPVPEVVVVKNKKTNKVTKPTGTTTRRGRGKGVKNKMANKKVVAAAIAATQEKNESSSKVPLEGALYVCQHDNCGRSFTRPYNLTSHMRTHTTERPYACSHCGRRFARQHDRNRHEKLHWGIRPYACHHCHKSFARMDALNRHLRMENGCTGVHL